MRFTFVEITSGQLSATNNPLSVAENALQTEAKEIIYVSISDNAGFTDYAPLSYTMYEIRHTKDTVTVNVIDYYGGQVKINCKARNASNWAGWKTISGS